MVIHDTMRAIHAIASQTRITAIGADDLFPIWLYVTIHSDIMHYHEYFTFMQHFAFDDENMTQLGYCLTTFAAALHHISSVNLADFPALRNELKASAQ
jgi:hypothetical protein